MKLIIYQALARLWGDGKMSSWNTSEFNYLKSLGVDYIWFTGIPRHATGKDFVKGNPGSPYSVTDWMDTNPYLADNPKRRMAEFKALVGRTHKAGLKCITDFIPNHVARDYKGKIARFDYCDADWTDTFKVNWSDPGTLPAMLEVLRFWASAGVDGFRCDMVELVPADGLRQLISSIKSEFPGTIFIAEVYGRENYGKYAEYVGFDLLYDKAGCYDILHDIICCGASARKLTWNWQELGNLQPKMLNFLENHDERRLASPEFAGTPEKTYAAVAFAALYNTASFMVYSGQEIGENAADGWDGRTSIFDWCTPLSAKHLKSFISSGKGLGKEEKRVFDIYRAIFRNASRPAFRTGETWDLCYCQPEGGGFNPDRHFAFLRYDKKSRTAYVVTCNFSEETLETVIRIPPEPLGKEKEVAVSIPANLFSISEVYFE